MREDGNSLTSPPGEPGKCQAALSYARNGIPVFPLWHVMEDGKCACGDPSCDDTGKHPYVKRGFYAATTDLERVEKWWRRCPECNIGVPTGRRSGLLVLDIDASKGGFESLMQLQRDHEPLPETRSARSGGGGQHLYFRYPKGNVDIRCSAGKLGSGLDVRAEGGYVIVAPSVTGDEYRWINQHGPTDPPHWLVARMTERKDSASRSVIRHYRRETLPAVEGGTPIREGVRNETLFRRHACWLRARGCGETEIHDELEKLNAVCCEPPLDDAEIKKIAASAARYKRGDAKVKASPEVVRPLRLVEENIRTRSWPGRRGKSARSVMAALLLHAEKHGQMIPSGVRVSIALRPLAIAAGLGSTNTLRAAIDWLKRAELLRSDNLHRSGTQASAFVLLVPRAQLTQSTTTEGVIEGKCSNVSVERAPQLRWSVDGRRRLGKNPEQMIDLLVAKGRPISLVELATALGVKRVRDLRRRHVRVLESAEVIECSGDEVSLSVDWREALERLREETGEIEAETRDRERYSREREAYERYIEQKRRGVR